MIAVFAIDCRVDFRKDGGGYSRKGVGGGTRSEEGFPLLKDRRERHLTSGVQRRLGVIVDSGKSGHISGNLAAPGIASFRSE